MKEISKKLRKKFKEKSNDDDKEMEFKRKVIKKKKQNETRLISIMETLKLLFLHSLISKEIEGKSFILDFNLLHVILNELKLKI